MKKTSEIMLPLVAGLAIALGIIIGRSTKPSQTAAPIVMQQPGNKLSEILNLIDASYVDTVDVEQMVEEAIPTVLDKLDPHTLYIPAEEMQQVNEEMEGNFGGIGVQFSIQEDTVVIVSVISGGPSSQLGILPGDRIIAVADTAFTGKKINNTNVMKSLRGEIGTTVRITVLRGNSHLDFNITRGLIPINSVDVAYMVDNSLGYIKIDRFAQTTYDEMLRAIAQLKNSGCTRLLVDLRGNSGGLLDIAIKMCNEFLHKGPDCLHRRPNAAARRRQGQRHGHLPGHGPDRADRRIFGIGKRDFCRLHAGQRPRHHRGSPLVWQRLGPAADSAVGQLVDPPDRGPIPHGERTLHPAPL